jgi:hypothetical protein
MIPDGARLTVTTLVSAGELRALRGPDDFLHYTRGQMARRLADALLSQQGHTIERSEREAGNTVELVWRLIAMNNTDFARLLMYAFDEGRRVQARSDAGMEYLR